MSMELGVKKFSTAPRYFEAGDYPIAKDVKVAAEDLASHAPVARFFSQNQGVHIGKTVDQY